MVENEFLRRIPLFAELPAEQIDHLANQVYQRRYQRGTIIFGEGEPSEAAYFVKEGRVKVYRLSPEGQEQIFGVFGPGQPFGLVTALDGSHYPATAEATENSLIWMIRTEHLQGLMFSIPRLASGVLREVGCRLRQAQGRVHSLSVRSVHQRLAEYLLAQTREQEATDSIPVRLTMTHQELGNYLGASRETVTRALADLRHDGAVSPITHETLLVNTSRLRTWLEG